MAIMDDLKKVYQNKTVLVTGHTGFKGSWLSLWLIELGAKVVGYALDPVTPYDNFVLTGLKDKMIDIRGDIRDKQKLLEVFETHEPEMVFHLAAQPIVREAYLSPVETFETNVMGTVHVLECIRNTPSTKVGICITTDKCYENKEQLWGYKENDAMGGYDPYSASKGAAELAIASYRQSYMNTKAYEKHHKAIASVRAGNVIGGGDWSKDRIMPDCIRAIETNKPIIIRNPKAIRPWQHVLEPLNGYLLLGAKLLENPTSYSEGWNFGPYLQDIVPVWEVAKKLVKAYGKGQLEISSTQEELHETTMLNLDISKSVFKLGWQPKWHINEAINYTAQWYKNYQKEDVYELCKAQILAYKTNLSQS